MPRFPDPERRRTGRAARAVWLTLGLLCVGLGFVGVMVPLMPTTIFLILAAGCFARSSPRLEAWLLDHPRFGPTLRNWRTEGAISRSGKTAACAGIALGFALFFVGAHPGPGLLTAVGTAMGACAFYILTRPHPSKDSL